MSRVVPLVGLVWGVAPVFGSAARAQISPGPLARPHAQLEGALRCTNCHGGRGVEMTRQCLQCHREIAWLLEQRRGYHARQRGTRCASCHPDHAGREFSLISWPGGDQARFDHAEAGWKLEGRHRAIECGDCHKPALRSGPAAALAPRPAASPRWVGFEKTCTSCHPDVHRGSLSQNCLTCHDEARWSPAPAFDHAETDYPLTGKHRDVRCASCHKAAAGDSVPVFKPVAHRDCVSCHADPHRGRFTGPCRDCHVTAGFTVIDRGTFNHNRTRFPLRGLHASVSCSKCHDVPGRAAKDPPFATCTACHADPHAGTATLAGVAVDCDACHTEAGFKIPAFTVAQHRRTKYPLEGRHERVACTACHAKHPPGVPAARLGTAGIQMRPAFGRCLECHRDEHGGQLTTRPDLRGGECAACHAVTGWTPSTFTVAAHATTRFRLEARHVDIACGACHSVKRARLAPLPAAATLGRGGVRFRLAELECVSCHVDPHQGRFTPGGARPARGGCLACHTGRSFATSTVDVAAHGGYAFKLEGAHRAVPCVACHAELKRPAAASTLIGVRWMGAPLSFTVRAPGCVACHDNPHGDQFAGRPGGGDGCDSCHGLEAFAPASRFDHDRDTKLPLRGGHANVPCARCHREVTGRGAVRLVRYRPVSTRCESCHGDGVRP